MPEDFATPPQNTGLDMEDDDLESFDDRDSREVQASLPEDSWSHTTFLEHEGEEH